MRALVVLLTLVACSPAQRPTMNPGVDCLLCHTDAVDTSLPSAPQAPGQRAGGLPFSVAGTVFRAPNSPEGDGVQGVHLLIHNTLVPDAGVELVTNSTGNFYSSEQLFPSTGLSVELVYNGQRVAMVTHPSPIQLYGPTSQIAGVGCNGCHGVPAAPTPVPDSGPPGTCITLPDGGVSDTHATACRGDGACCSGYCVNGTCAPGPGTVGDTCTSSADCTLVLCVDGLCAFAPGENGHGCTSGSDCHLAYCEGGVCTGAPGRISIPGGLRSTRDGGWAYGNP